MNDDELHAWAAAKVAELVERMTRLANSGLSL